MTTTATTSAITATMRSVGIDIGAQKTIVVSDDGERILTSTGGMTRPTLVLFNNNSRLAGEEASHEMMSENMIAFLSELFGRSLADISNLSFLPHTKLRLVEKDGLLYANVHYREQEAQYSITAILAIFLHQLAAEIIAPNPSQLTLPTLAFPLPHGYTRDMERAIREACMIAGITQLPSSLLGDETQIETPKTQQADNIVFVDAAECLARAYARKLSALKGADSSQLEGQKVLLLEMGHVHTTVVIVIPQPGLQTVSIDKIIHSSQSGSFQFDCALYSHFVQHIETKHHCLVEAGTKKGMRVMRECERLRKLLSQLPTSSVTIENISDSGDVNVTMTRDEMARICSEPLEKLRQLLTEAIDGIKDEIVAVELVGGGVRMAMVQEILLSVLGKELPLGAKLDDGSIAVGAAILANELREKEVKDLTEMIKEDNLSNEKVDEPSLPEIPTTGLSLSDLLLARQTEVAMQMKDQEVREHLECRNVFEAYLLDMKGVPNRKHGHVVDRVALNSALESKENWLWDHGESATLLELQQEFSQLKETIEGQLVNESSESPKEIDEATASAPTAPLKKRRIGGICSEYLNAVEDDRLMLEETLAAESALAAEQRAADGEDEDHDFRKLKKADRMRLVIKNKDEGTELFKGGNIRPAAARYQKALSHAAKFFDLSPEDTEEVNQVKLSIHLNLTQCYLKMENWDFAIKYAGEALAISPTSAKAFFRRSAAYEAKKDYEKALEDLKLAANNTPNEDKAVTKSIDRVKKLMQKEKDKEKKMWGKAFAS